MAYASLLAVGPGPACPCVSSPGDAAVSSGARVSLTQRCEALGGTAGDGRSSTDWGWAYGKHNTFRSLQRSFCVTQDQLFIALGGTAEQVFQHARRVGVGGGALDVPSTGVAFLRTPGTRSLSWCSSVRLATRKPNSRGVLLHGQLLKYFCPGGRDGHRFLRGGKVGDLVGRRERDRFRMS